MDIIVVSSREGQMKRYSLQWRRFWVWLPFVVLALGLLALAAAAGYALRAPASTLPAGLIATWTDEATQQRALVESARTRANEEARALARRLALIQAQTMRLEAVSDRLGVAAGLDPDEFSFDDAAAVGGPETDTPSYDFEFGEVVASLTEIERKLGDRERQLRVLEDLLLAGRLEEQRKPSGWPVAAGFISSVFGMRADPFTGRRSIHEGVDFAARAGTEIYAVGSGVVTYSARRGGYGNMVEISHGNGYTTRYSHNQRNIVREGDRVYKGQLIALIGSTGRATGPHLHFEVLYDGRIVNPQKYIQAAR